MLTLDPSPDPLPLGSLPPDASRLIAQAIAFALPAPALSPEWRAIRERLREAVRLHCAGGFVALLCRKLGWPTFSDLCRADVDAAAANSEVARAFATLAAVRDAEAAEVAANDPKRRFYADMAEDIRRAILAPPPVEV